ncbi:MAG: 6,7-dimethyl-8-ribityllumazine synthase [Acidimicrobiales bacterium]
MGEAPHRLGAPHVASGDYSEIVGSHDGSLLHVGLACARFNQEITLRLLDGAKRQLDASGVEPGARTVVWVPGSFELPLAAQALALGGAVDAIVCLGAVVRGETAHFEFVAGQCSAGLQQVQLETRVPTVFGVLTTETWDQALERSGGKLGNKGAEAVETAVEMVNALAAIADLTSEVGRVGREPSARGRRAKRGS